MFVIWLFVFEFVLVGLGFVVVLFLLLCGYVITSYCCCLLLLGCWCFWVFCFGGLGFVGCVLLGFWFGGLGWFWLCVGLMTVVYFVVLVGLCCIGFGG